LLDASRNQNHRENKNNYFAKIMVAKIAKSQTHRDIFCKKRGNSYRRDYAHRENRFVLLRRLTLPAHFRAMKLRHPS